MKTTTIRFIGLVIGPGLSTQVRLIRPEISVAMLLPSNLITTNQKFIVLKMSSLPKAHGTITKGSAAVCIHHQFTLTNTFPVVVDEAKGPTQGWIKIKEYLNGYRHGKATAYEL